MSGVAIPSVERVPENQPTQETGVVVGNNTKLDQIPGKSFQPDDESLRPSLGEVASIRVEVDFRELDDGSLVELVEDPEDPTRTRLAVWKDGEVQYRNQLKYGNQILLPRQRTGEILPYLRLPQAALPYASVPALLEEIAGFLSSSVVLPQGYDKILASFVLSTWLGDRFLTAPYVSLLGLPQSGKTTLLRTLRLICRRPLLVADITSAAFYDACAQLSPTLLIDETGTIGNSRQLHHLLRMGTTRDLLAMKKGRTFHAFGPKVIAFLEPPDDPALISRCILIPMHEANPPTSARSSDPSQELQGMELQGKLLQFRFDHYESIRLVEVPGAKQLRPRTQDLLSILAAPFAEDPEHCDYLFHFFQLQDEAKKEPLEPEKSVVLAALFSMVHFYNGKNSMWVSEVGGVVNDMLKRGGESMKLTPRKVGSVLTSLGFLSRKRTNKGWTITLYQSDKKRIHEMVKNHGLDNLVLMYFEEWAEQEDLEWVPPEECPLCKKFNIK